MGNLFSIPNITTDDMLSCCWEYIAGQTSYTRKLEENLKALGVELEKLKAQRDDVSRMVDLAEKQLMKRLSQVQLWLSRVQSVVTEVEELLQDGPKEIQRLCLAGCFSKDFNYFSSYRFGKLVADKIQEMVDLKNEGVFDKVAENEPAPPVDVRPIEPTVGLDSTLNRVWRLLQGDDVGIIGLHGLGGVGKTTLLTQINNKLSNTILDFEVVIWVVVSKDHLIEKVQEKICEKVGLPSELWMNKSCDDKAILISRVLSKMKFVLLMDDVWERVDLIRVGIPTPNQGNGCKLIFTTRFLEVCSQMGAHEKIRVECLGAEDAWKLFVQKIGEENLDNHILKLAKQVAEKCGGLPLALITIGRAMACKKTYQDWKYALEVLKEFPHKLARMDLEVYSLLKFSYDGLPNDTMRSCLLYCSLFPEDYMIDKHIAVDYWFCEGFLDEFDDLGRARLQGHNIITCLINACLLETCEGIADSVKMHDVIRDMCLWIASEFEEPEKKFYVRASSGSIGAVLDVKNWEGARMSLAGSGIEHLRGTPLCPNLQTLFLNHNQLGVIGEGFFGFMRNLKVSNLSKNLKLKELPEGIWELDSLQCLNLSWTGIRELPIKLNRLSNLKCLNFLESPYLKKIPRQVICNLSRLQIFRMTLSDEVPNGMDEDNVLNGGNESLIEELKCLQHLNVLTMEIKSTSALEIFLSALNIPGCTQQLSLNGLLELKELDVLPLVNMKCLETLVVRNCKSMEEMKMEGRRMMQASTSLFPNNHCFQFHTLRRVYIVGCPRLREMTWLILAPNLTWLSVAGCSKVEELTSHTKLSGISYPNPFAKLRTLYLRDLPELKSIYWDVLPFPCLTEINVINCSKLKKLPLNLDCAKGNQINIEGNQEWWDEVEWEDEATRNAFLPSFKRADHWWKDVDWKLESWKLGKTGVTKG